MATLLNEYRCLHNIEDQSEISPSCRLCGEICDEDQTLRKHFRTSHPQSLPFCCSVCNAEFDSKAAEKEHFSSHLNSEDFTCIICSLNLPTYKDLYFHYKQDHVTNQQNICNICNKMFPNKAQLKMHRCDLAEQRTKCIFCHKVCSSGAALNIHIKRHTNKKIFKCKVCYRSFFDTGDLMKHMLFHATAITGERPLLRCCLCFVTYRHLPILKNHIRKTHFYKELNCPICGVELMDDQVVASHLIRHSVRISKGTMSKVEVQWAEQNKAKSIESATASRKGRPRKYFNSSNTATSTTSLLQSQDSNHTQMTSNKNETSKITNEGITNGDQYSRAIDDDSSTVNIQTNKKTGRKSTMPRISKVAKQDGPNNTSSEKKGTKQSSIILWKKHQIEAEGIIQNNSTTKQRPITNQIETEGINKNNSTKKQRPMFFMKVTSSGKKSNKPRKCNNDNLTVKKNTQTSTSNKRISTYDHDSNDFTCLNNTGDKHIKDERLSPVDNSNLSVDENFVDSIKHEQDFYPAKVKEESESCIKEMKYYEPSLDLTEYCCTTCHLSFSSHNELLVHTTLHIL